MLNAIISELMKLAVAGSPALSIVLKATVITLLALLVSRLAQRTRASIRHALLAALFALLLVLPFSSALAPPVRVAVPIFAQPETVQSSFEAVADAPSTALAAHETAFVPSQVPQSSGLPASTLLFAIWIAGTIFFLMPVAAGLWQTR